MKTIYIIKTNGREKIPDYIQLRDDNFTLLGYFSIKNIQRNLKNEDFADEQIKKIISKMNEIPYNKIHKLIL